MEEDIAVDESLMKFNGEVLNKVCNISNWARFGIKFYKPCESASGYCHNFKIHSGKYNDIQDFNSFEAVVMDMLDSLINKGHTLYIDNWYSSPRLFLYSKRNGTNVFGTVRANRKNMPNDFEKKKFKKGNYIFKSCNGIMAMKWKDVRDVQILSTLHKNV